MRHLVPELQSSDFERSFRFYTEIVGFHVVYSRSEERFAYLARGDAELMIEQTQDPTRRLVAGPLEYPWGRGVNLQIRVDDVDALYRAVQIAGTEVFLPLEERWYRRDHAEFGNRQFVVLDPDGYMLRFAQDLGQRSTAVA
jgi:catechol 2,3-dioxygenase-like lactoylglutathione lyase family enzyme